MTLFFFKYSNVESNILKKTKLILKWICHGAISKREGKSTRQQFSYWEETKLKRGAAKAIATFLLFHSKLLEVVEAVVQRRTRKTSKAINNLELLFYRLIIVPTLAGQIGKKIGSLWKHKGFDGVFLVPSEKKQFPLYSSFWRLKFLCV